MEANTASAIFQDKWLIEPGYAKANAGTLAQLLKDQIVNRTALHNARLQHNASQTLQQMQIPQRKTFAAVSSDLFHVNPYTSTDRLPYNSIVIVDVIGPIMKYGSWYSWGTAEINELIIRLANSDRVKGILLNVDGPGGQVAGTAELAQTIRSISKVKPVIAVVQDGMAASSTYWIASAAQEIWLTQPTSQVGSIGIYTTVFDDSKMYEQMGIIIKAIYADDAVDKNQDVIQAIKGDESIIKADLKFLNDFFISTVKANRGQRIKSEGKEPFTGKMYFAPDGAKQGLIEGVKPMAGIVARLEQLIALRA